MVTKMDLVDSVVDQLGCTKKVAAKAVDAFCDTICGAVGVGDDVRLSGFGSFLVKTHAERRGRNPATGMEMIIPARKTVVFKPSKALREAVQ